MKFYLQSKNSWQTISNRLKTVTAHKSLWLKIKQCWHVILAFFRREKVRRITTTIVIALAVVIFLFEATFAGLIYIGKQDNPYVRKVAEFIPFPLVIVNFNVVTVNDYYFEDGYIEHFYNQSQRAIPEDISKQIVDQLIDTKILKIKAPAYGVKITKEEINETISDLVDQSGGQQEVEKVLSSYYGLTLKDFRTLVADQLLRVKMKDTVPVQVQASHILVKVDSGADQATIDAAKAKADGILAELKNGADFAQTAQTKSDDTGSRDQGGELGWFGRGDMVTSFENQAFSMKSGDISEPIRTDFGWHIIKVTDRKGYEDMSFDDWLASVRNNSFIRQLATF